MTDSEIDFLAHDDELAELIRKYDWSKTSLGPPRNWPEAVKVTTTTILQSPVSIVTLGREDVMIYNDAYSVFAGGRHPELLGSKVRDGWPELARLLDMRVGMTADGSCLLSGVRALARTWEQRKENMVDPTARSEFRPRLVQIWRRSKLPDDQRTSGRPDRSPRDRS
jgi:hypothetical protein